MVKEMLMFGNIEIENNKFYCSKNSISTLLVPCIMMIKLIN